MINRDNICQVPHRILFSFGYFLMKCIFPHTIKACRWHYFQFYIMSEGCKIFLVQLKMKLYFFGASSMEIMKALSNPAEVAVH